jgi:hypothetical protein
MKLKVAFIAIAIACLFQVPSALAQNAQALMTDRELGKFITDWPDTAKWSESKSQKIEEGSSGAISAALLANKEFEAFLAKRGWKLDRFAYVTGTVFSLMTVVTIERKNPEIAKQFDDAIAQIEASELSRAEKDQNIQTMNDTKKAMLALSSDKSYNEAELKLVRARYAEIAKAAGIDTD